MNIEKLLIIAAVAFVIVFFGGIIAIIIVDYYLNKKDNTDKIEEKDDNIKNKYYKDIRTNIDTKIKMKMDKTDENIKHYEDNPVKKAIEDKEKYKKIVIDHIDNIPNYDTSEVLVPDKVKEKADNSSFQNEDAKRYKIDGSIRDIRQMKTEILKTNTKEKIFKTIKRKIDIPSNYTEKKKKNIDIDGNNEDNPIKFL